MYHIKFHSYVPEPTPVTTDRIVAAHYYAAWKKGAAGLHEGFDDLAEEYPDRTPLMGYYEEEDPEVCDWEIKWAIEHGINCFIHCWYRKKENENKPVTVADLRCGHGLHEALFHAKYRQLMKFAIMFEASPRWGGTNEQDMLQNLMPFWMEQYFKRENYLVIDNKPVLFVFSQSRLAQECFADAESQRRTFDACRDYARSCGFDGMLFAVCSIHGDRQKYDDLKARGYDLRFGYTAGYNSPYDFFEDQEAIVEGQLAKFREELAFDPKGFIPTASCFWDPTPRFSQRWVDMGCDFRSEWNIWYLQPEGFKALLKRLKAACDTLPEDAIARKLLMIDNWNEWDEGHFVAPSHQFGFKYLQAIREALSACDNLPDYITPADRGFESYNRSWRTPDFAAFCEKRLKEKQ